MPIVAGLIAVSLLLSLLLSIIGIVGQPAGHRPAVPTRDRYGDPLPASPNPGDQETDDEEDGTEGSDVSPIMLRGCSTRGTRPSWVGATRPRPSPRLLERPWKRLSGRCDIAPQNASDGNNHRCSRNRADRTLIVPRYPSAEDTG
jgi:hypothetical protein